MSAVIIYAIRCSSNALERKEPDSHMSTNIVSKLTLCTLSSKVPPHRSEVGNEVYASHYAERKLSRFVIGTEIGSCCLAAMGLIFSLAHRPIANRYIRIDELGRAQAIAYTDLKYSPREGEVRTYLTDWANYRYTLNRETIAKKYPLNYYFLSQNLGRSIDDRRIIKITLVSQVDRRAGRAERSGGEERHHNLHV